MRLKSQIMFLILVTLIFSGCGGGSENAQEQPELDVPLPPTYTQLIVDENVTIKSRINTDIPIEVSGDNVSVKVTSSSELLTVNVSGSYLSFYTSSIEPLTHKVTVTANGDSGQVSKDVMVAVDPSVNFKDIFIGGDIDYGCILSEHYNDCWHIIGDTGPQDFGFTWKDVESVFVNYFDACYIIGAQIYCSDVWGDDPIDTSLFPSRHYLKAIRSAFLHSYGIVVLYRDDNGDYYTHELTTRSSPIDYDRWHSVAYLESGGIECFRPEMYNDEICDTSNSITSILEFDLEDIIIYTDKNGFGYYVRPDAKKYEEKVTALEAFKPLVSEGSLMVKLHSYPNKFGFIDKDGFITYFDITSENGQDVDHTLRYYIWHHRTEIKAKKLLRDMGGPEVCYITETSRVECLNSDKTINKSVPWEVSTYD
ncbi:hypothetical protein [Thalassotalea maritima]|uniref:hypothetical protein n=1 Tax=Thalassotalea maritima TaxID=3242416 RepID=UPI003529883F